MYVRVAWRQPAPIFNLPETIIAGPSIAARFVTGILYCGAERISFSGPDGARLLLVEIRIDLRKESREMIKTWAPGQKAEDFVISALIEAVKPVR